MPCCSPPNQRQRALWRGLVARVLAASVLAALSLGAAPAAAGTPPAYDVIGLHPSAHLADGWWVRGAAPMQDGQWSLGATLQYARLPLRFSRGGLQQAVVGDGGVLGLGAAVGLPRGWNATLHLPVAWMLRGGGPNLAQLDAWPAAPALGDLRAGVRRRFWQGPLGSADASVAAALDIDLPTASAAAWLGGAGAATAEVLATATLRAWRGDATLGVRWMPTQVVTLRPLNGDGVPSGSPRDALRLGSSVRMGAAVARALVDGRLTLRGELAVQVPLIDTIASSLSVVDLLASADWALRPWLRGALGLGGSPSSGVGAAAVRVLAMLRFDPSMLPSDVDGDGLDDRDDRCPAQAEDRDGFDDRDGCPDADDDDDGVVDVADRCRLVAEDRDGFDDADGCPDTDDDRDGIDDAKDRCPRAAEDVDGFDDLDGCPDGDDDGDGFPDSADLCPRSAENTNGFEDGDGCPDVAPGEGGLDLPQPQTPEQPPPPPAAALPPAPPRPVAN